HCQRFLCLLSTPELCLRQSEQRPDSHTRESPRVLGKFLGCLLIISFSKIREPQPQHGGKVIRIELYRRLKRRLGGGELPLFELDDTAQKAYDRQISAYAGRCLDVLARFV